MDIHTLKEKIENLNPKIHKALRDALIARYNQLTGNVQDNTDTFAEMFRKATDELNRRYIAGTINYIEKNHIELHLKTKRTESRLNDIWIKGLAGESDISEFRKALKEWYLLQLRMIDVYSKEQSK